MRTHLQFLVLAGCLHGVPDNLEVKPEPKPVAAALPVEAAVTSANRTTGPLSIDASFGGDAGFAAAVQRDSTRVMSADDLAVDAAVLEQLVTGWPDLDPKTMADDRAFLHQLGTKGTLRADYLRTMIEDLTRPFGGCVRPFATVQPCIAATGLAAQLHTPPVSLERDGEIAVLTVRDFDAVESFDLAPLASAKAVVLDLNAARGGRVTWLVPWIQKLAGAAWRKPLHAARTHARADADVRSYQDRFLPDAARDLAEWAALVDSTPHGPIVKTTTVPIEILIGRDCQSACELVTRMLEAYTDARVYGFVDDHGRLIADNPARVVLPRSKITIYYNATRYELDPAIVAVSGPSNDWNAKHASDGGVSIEYAMGEAMRRLAHTEVDCKTLPAYPYEQLKRVPTLNFAYYSPGSQSVDDVLVASTLPASAISRIAKQCGFPADSVVSGSYGEFTYRVGGTKNPDPAALSRFAQYPGIAKVKIEPIPQVHLL